MAETIELNEGQRKIHEDLLNHLLAIRQSLMAVDSKSLTSQQLIEWNDQIDQVALAISAAEGAILTSISEDYAKILPNTEKATKKLTDALSTLKKANDAIAAVGSVLGIIRNIAVLLG